MKADEIVTRLRSARKQSKMPQKTLAQLACVTQSALSKWEVAERSPTLRHAVRWAEALGKRLVIE